MRIVSDDKNNRLEEPKEKENSEKIIDFSFTKLL